MQIYPGAHLIECEVGGRPLYLPLLIGETESVLLDCGTRTHAAKDIPEYLGEIDLPEDALTFLVITHPDTDHSGGAGEFARSYPHLRIMCGDADSRCDPCRPYPDGWAAGTSYRDVARAACRKQGGRPTLHQRSKLASLPPKESFAFGLSKIAVAGSELTKSG
jgi:glyoxylase-like metal-dependent hydrolase (beta-lactamase superfamily II)